MIKKIFRSTFFATLGVLLVTLFMVVGLLYGYFTQVQKEQLQTETGLAAQGVSLEGQDYFNELKMSNVRITWVEIKEKFSMIMSLMHRSWTIMLIEKKSKKL